MRVDYATRTLYLDITDVDQMRDCPVCSDKFRPNGTGPANKPAVARALKYLPSEHYLGGMAPTAHDWAYLVCPKGWTVVCTYGGRDYVACDREGADRMYEEIMHAQVTRRLPWAARWWGHLQAERNAEFVRACGADSYKHIHRI